MRNIGSIAGKIEILAEDDGSKIGLIGPSNYCELNGNEALDLATAIFVNAKRLGVLPITTFIPYVEKTTDSSV